MVGPWLDTALWAAPVVFALAFGESLAFISLLIPAWAALIGIGVLIASGNLSFWPIWVALLVVSSCELHFGIPMGRRAAHGR
jgi:membrane protein DedA with SNARE-associated domain